MLRVIFAGMLALMNLLSTRARAEASEQVSGRQAPEASVFHADIAAHTRQNTAFRRVLFTAKKMQIVAMSIPPGGDIGEEKHQRVEQVLFVVEGEGKAVINGVASPFQAGDVVLVTPGVRHDFINTGKTPLKLYTLYAPPNHLPGRVHLTKADAEADVENEAFGRMVE